MAIIVIGECQLSNNTDKNGHKQTGINIIVSRIKFLTRNPKTGNPADQLLTNDENSRQREHYPSGGYNQQTGGCANFQNNTQRQRPQGDYNYRDEFMQVPAAGEIPFD